MAWIDAFRGKREGQTKQGTNDDLRYLAAWSAARTGVEA
ncbi:oxidoreductase, partial [Mycobacteroides abscessus subsp. massiliense]|nr:oxidoreductase [Mycobacteroides abscessus subsp. massiliense]